MYGAIYSTESTRDIAYVLKTGYFQAYDVHSVPLDVPGVLGPIELSTKRHSTRRLNSLMYD